MVPPADSVLDRRVVDDSGRSSPVLTRPSRTNTKGSLSPLSDSPAHRTQREGVPCSRNSTRLVCRPDSHHTEWGPVSDGDPRWRTCRRTVLKGPETVSRSYTWHVFFGPCDLPSHLFRSHLQKFYKETFLSLRVPLQSRSGRQLTHTHKLSILTRDGLHVPHLRHLTSDSERLETSLGSCRRRRDSRTQKSIRGVQGQETSLFRLHTCVSPVPTIDERVFRVNGSGFFT